MHNLLQISRQSRRKVISDITEDYGPINATVQVDLKIIESNSKQLLSEDVKPYLLNDTDFLESLKLIGSSRDGTILLLHFLDPLTILLIYANSKQASIAAAFLDNYIIPWDSSSNGLPKITGGYEIHLSTSLYNSTNWLDRMQRLIEISEREESNINDCRIPAEIFNALPSIKKLDKQRPSKFDDNNGQTSNNDNEDFENDITNLTINRAVEPSQPRNRPPPPRPAPPLIKQSMNISSSISSNYSKDEFDDYPTNNNNNSVDAKKVNISDPLSQTDNEIDSEFDKIFSISHSLTTSPVHEFSSKLNTTISNDLFTPYNGSIHMVSSCVDLNFQDNSILQHDNNNKSRILSTTDLIGLEFEKTNSTIINDTTLSSTHLLDPVIVPPPLPQRPENFKSSHLEQYL
ncbi:unnamed protein product [Schistosoma curassoni]|uniref:Uncharacterized protein n=1 Tax=Schistosoma curassoni TaxID=6186 RepID=A0A3P8IWY3_9TREM|nr:unnamed protein product [Schistosoma curassoni]